MSRDNTKGFTLIELMLAMTFIAVLLVAIAMTTIQVSNIYNKGITLREVNQAGRTLNDELQRNIASSVPFDATPKVDDSPLTATSKYVVREGDGGRLCLGSYTYAWNYGKSLVGAVGSIFNKYSDGTPVSFVKVADPNSSLCADPTLAIQRDNATEMLSSGDRDLVVHDFKIAQTSTDAGMGQALYAISFTIGTNDRAQLTANDASCKPPSAGVGDEDYCSVNQFDLVARAGDSAGGGE